MYKVKKYLSNIFLFALLFIVGAGCFYFYSTNSNTEVVDEPISIEIPPAPTLQYGFDVNSHHFEDFRIKPNAFMGDILMSYGISFDSILELERKAEDVHSLRRIKAGKDITFIKKDECGGPLCFIYKPGLLSYIRYDIGDQVAVTKHEIPYETCVESASGVVNSSLWEAMKGQDLDNRLIDNMEDALSQVSFDYAQPGDQFKLIFERVYIEGKPAKTGKIYSAVYKSGDDIDYGFYFENDKYQGYYDYEGTPNKRTFLNAPIKFSYRISSGYNPNRFHPILKRRKAHLGTDYAADRGAPIIAVANGVVTKRSYTKGNGNYIKIKHDNVYQTQYLHMSRFAKGVVPGTRVKQGQTIGYVGSTGLATGPHVCFRFWKNGRQINHRRENFPPLDPMEKHDLPVFFNSRDELVKELNHVPFADPKIAYAGYAD